jgi:ABC-type amino acid transport substrate-binding protein
MIAGLLGVTPCFAQETPATLEVGIADASFPSGYRLPSGEMAGSFVRVLAMLSEASGIKLEVRGYPWARVQAMVKSGELAAFCGVETAERDEIALFAATSVLKTPIGIYVRADDRRFDRVETLQGLKPFRNGSYIGNGWVKENFDETKIVWARTYEDVLKMIDGHRVDFMVGDAYSLPQRLASLGLDGKIVFRPVKFESDVAFRFAIRRDVKNAPDIIARIDRAMLQIRQDPAFAEAAAPYK